jgi:hypothetical protein
MPFGLGGPTDRNSRAGAGVPMTVPLQPACAGARVTGTVSYVPSSAKSGIGPTAPGDPSALLAGMFSAKVP